MSKKSFKDEFNPALDFISTAPSEGQGQEPESISAGVPMKRNPEYIETKSKRVQLLMQPSLHIKLQAIAGQKGSSLNDLIHTMLEQSARKAK